MRPPHVSSRRSTGIRPISSVAESDRSRGIAITLERNRWQLIALYSKLHLDGNIEGENISALSETGLHRTERELAHRRRVPMKHWGAHLGWRGDQLNLGVGALALRIDRAISKRVKIWTNIALYKANWQGHLYLPEPNMKHQYGFSMLYGKGIRLASGLEWLCTKRITLALRGVYTPSDTKTMANGNYIALGVYYR